MNLVELEYITELMQCSSTFPIDFRQLLLNPHHSYKVHPYIPDPTHFDPELSLCPEDVDNLYEWGFNFVRSVALPLPPTHFSPHIRYADLE